MRRLAGILFILIVLISAISSHGNSHKAALTGSTPPAAAPSPPSPHRSVTHVHYTACDQNISAGPHTTCGFADNVFRAFAHEAAQGEEEATVTASSPATGKTYTVRCDTTDGLTVCDGSSARVRFPLWAAKVYYKAGGSGSEPNDESNTSLPAAEPESAPESSTEPEEGPGESGSECTKGTYENSSGNIVCRPEESSTVPAGATARCADGTYSFSEHRSGTCSYHGGVSEWLGE